MSLVHCPSSWFPLSRHGQCCDFGGGQYFGHPMQRTDSLEKTLMLGKTEGKRRRRRQDDKGRDSWVASLTLWTWVWAGSGGDGQGSLMCCSPWGRKESDTTERLSWTESMLFHHHVPSITSQPPRAWLSSPCGSFGAFSMSCSACCKMGRGTLPNANCCMISPPKSSCYL